MANSTDSYKILSSNELSTLSREELILQLLKAQEKIQRLEEVAHEKHENTFSSNNNFSSVSSSCISAHPGISKSTEESIFAYPSGQSIDSSSCEEIYVNQTQVMNELQSKLVMFEKSDPHKSFHQYSNDEEFIVAYEHHGEFPSCDEDISPPSVSGDEERSHQVYPDVIVNDLKSGEYDTANDNNRLEAFPLIPSPVITTPPYEYIFLTKTNEAKYRIFLNQKLNKVFQEEIQKLQRREAQLIKDKSYYHVDQGNENDHELQSADQIVQLHIKSHRTSDNVSENGSINSSVSVSNVIHCFDPSDVDIELKKIFTEKPPITHKIVRRRARQERGSSVPAVDSYYGTRDLHKVGHASYFIPTLTESERKAIGWKHEYHYGHWKYGTLNVPNNTTNQIPLRPHVETGDSTHSKNYSHHHSTSLPKNPLHHQEIDLSEPYVSENQKDGSLVSQHKSCSKKHHSQTEGPLAANENDETLSFITLSGGSKDLTQSCHIIPDKSTLRRILRWILPCIKLDTTSHTGNEDEKYDLNNNHEDEKPSGLNEKKSTTTKRSKDCKKQHEVETLVGPTGKLNFLQSQTYVSIASNSVEEHAILRNQASSDEDNDHHVAFVSSQDNHNKYHRGTFHWKTILDHNDDSKCKDSLNVIGGDVIASMHDYIEILKDDDGAKELDHITSLESKSSISKNEIGERYFESSSTESETDDDATSGARKKIGKLKACKAYTKLLTLKDLGYETDELGNIILNEDTKLEANREMGKTGALLSSRNSYNDTENLESSDNPPSSDITKRSNRQANAMINRVPVESSRQGLLDVQKFKSSISNLTGGYPDENISALGSEFPFSSLSISHQNSEIGSDFLHTENPTPSASRTEQQQNGVQTRFLDPKDLLIPEIKKPSGNNVQVNEDTLPFIFDFLSSQHDAEHEDEDVIEWMGCGFVDDIGDGEGLGLLSSCLETLLKHDKILKEQYKSRNMDAGIEHDKGSPEKAVGQHRITTLNDLNGKRDLKQNSTKNDQYNA